MVDISDGNREDYAGDGFAVIVTERFYLRNLDAVQATTIFDLVDDTTCDVTVVVGGGAGGLKRTDLGTETDETRKITRKFESLCDTLGLEIETVDD